MVRRHIRQHSEEYMRGRRTRRSGGQEQKSILARAADAVNDVKEKVSVAVQNYGQPVPKVYPRIPTEEESRNEFRERLAEHEDLASGEAAEPVTKRLRRERREEALSRKEHFEKQRELESKGESSEPESTQSKVVDIAKKTGSLALKTLGQGAAGMAKLGAEQAGEGSKTETDEDYILSGGRKSDKDKDANFKVNSDGYILARKSDGSWYNTGKKGKATIEPFTDPATGMEIEPIDDEDDEDEKEKGGRSSLGGRISSGILSGSGGRRSRDSPFKTGMFDTSGGESSEKIGGGQFGAGKYYMGSGMSYGGAYDRGKSLDEQAEEASRQKPTKFGAGKYFMTSGMVYGTSMPPSGMEEQGGRRRRDRNVPEGYDQDYSAPQSRPVSRDVPLFSGNTGALTSGAFGRMRYGSPATVVPQESYAAQEEIRPQKQQPLFSGNMNALSSGAFGNMKYGSSEPAPQNAYAQGSQRKAQGLFENNMGALSSGTFGSFGYGKQAPRQAPVQYPQPVQYRPAQVQAPPVPQRPQGMTKKQYKRLLREQQAAQAPSQSQLPPELRAQLAQIKAQNPQVSNITDEQLYAYLVQLRQQQIVQQAAAAQQAAQQPRKSSNVYSAIDEVFGGRVKY